MLLLSLTIEASLILKPLSVFSVTFHESVFPFKSLPSSLPLSQFGPFYHDCIPNVPPLPVIDSIHHSAPLTDPSAPTNFTILEDHFIDLPEDLFVFIPNDIINTPDLPNDITNAPDFLSIVPIIEFESTHTSAPTPASPILGDSLPRRSTRISRPPTYLQAYKCNATSIKYPIANYISSHKLSPSYSHFCNSISALQEPKFYHQAVGDPNWDAAMAAEI